MAKKSNESYKIEELESNIERLEAIKLSKQNFKEFLLVSFFALVLIIPGIFLMMSATKLTSPDGKYCHLDGFGDKTICEPFVEEVYLWRELSGLFIVFAGVALITFAWIHYLKIPWRYRD